jgi:hypothetical protein
LKGFVYLDVDGRLVHKTYEYITTENPGFWSDNEGYILQKWEFDTENRSSIVTLLKQLQSLQVDPDVVRAFRQSIGIPVRTSKNDHSV